MTAAALSWDTACDLEANLIGGVLNYPDLFSTISPLVEPDQFAENVHGMIWQAMRDLIADGGRVAVITIVSKLGNTEIYNGVTLSAYLAKCLAEHVCVPNVAADFAKQVREAWALRRAVEISETMKAEASRPGANPKILISEVMQAFDDTRARLDTCFTGFKPMDNIAVSVMDAMAFGMQHGSDPKAIRTGIADLDNRLGGGFRGGQLIIVAGRPGMGKTSVAVSLSRQSASLGSPIGFHSMEMPAEQIGSRFIADQAFGRTNVTANQILQGHLRDRDGEVAIEAAREIAALPLYIDDTSSLTVGDISARAYSLADRFMKRGMKLKSIYIDYLKFVRSSDRYRGQRHYEVGEITTGLKSLAKELDIAVVLLAQLNRQVETRDDKRPQLSDLRESGDIEPDADTVIFLFREAYYLEAKTPKPGSQEYLEWEEAMNAAHNKIEFIIAKQRMGPTGTVSAFCNVGSSAIRDLGQ